MELFRRIVIIVLIVIACLGLFTYWFINHLFSFDDLSSKEERVMVDSSGTERTVDTTAIIDPALWLPFSIEKRHPTAVLPDSLGGNGTKALALLNLYISEDAVIDSFEVIKLFVESSKGNILNYHKSQPATNAVKRFYPFFADYLKEEIVIKKDPEGRPG